MMSNILPNLLKVPVLCLAFAVPTMETCYAEVQGSSPPPLTVRTVEITVDVYKPDGTGFANFPITVRHQINGLKYTDLWADITNGSGRVVHSMGLAADTLDVTVGLGLRGLVGHPRLGALGSDPEGAIRKIYEQWSVPTHKTVVVPVGQTQTSIRLDLLEPVVVSGKLRRGSSTTAAIDGSAFVEGYQGGGAVLAGLQDGAFTLTVPKNQATMAEFEVGSQSLFVPIAAVSANLNMGTVVVTTSDVTVPLDVQITGTVATPVGPSITPNAVTLVKSDGLRAFEFRTRKAVYGANTTNPNTLIGATEDDTNLVPKVAPGTYYVMPELLGGSRATEVFLQALRSGENPSVSGVVKLVIPAGTNTFTQIIDMNIATRAYYSFVEARGTGKPAPPPLPTHS